MRKVSTLELCKRFERAKKGIVARNHGIVPYYFFGWMEVGFRSVLVKNGRYEVKYFN